MEKCHSSLNLKTPEFNVGVWGGFGGGGGGGGFELQVLVCWIRAEETDFERRLLTTQRTRKMFLFL